MRWQIEEFVFCDQQQLLISNNKEQQLEPILVTLLAYFCQYPDSIISRDELIEKVWLGRTVTDSAVNRAITKLRKCFQDDARAPKFIATFPKKGYKFIANPYPIQQQKPCSYTLSESSHFVTDKQQQELTPTPDSTNLPRNTLNTLIAVLVTSVLIGVSLIWNVSSWFTTNLAVSQLTTQAIPLTRSAGQEWQPSISPDSQHLAYTEVLNNKMRLYVKHLQSGSILEITPLISNPKEHQDAWIGPASWNKAGDKLVYLVASQDYCRYYMQSFANMQLGNPTLLHNCPAGSFGKIIFSHSDDLLVFAQRSGRDTPYEIFTLDLTTQQKRKVRQPQAMLGGNMMFDLHPTQNKLLISSVDTQMWEAFYSLELETEKLALLFRLDAYTCCAIWDHTGKRIVLMGEHPATQLVSYDLNGKDRRILYAGSHQLYAPERHPNGKDYVFPAGGGNLDIQFIKLSTNQSYPKVNNSVDDRLATISPREDKLAYIGLASGKEELWIVDLASGDQRQITQHNTERHFLDLSWSPDGNQIAGLTLNEIYLFDVNNNTKYQLKIPQSELRAISFKDPKTLYYSVKQNETWQLFSYDLAHDTMSRQDEKWRFVRFSSRPDDSIWVDQNFNLYTGATPLLTSSPVIDAASIISGANINIKKYGETWYWQQWDRDHYQLYKKSTESGVAKKLIVSDSPHFDILSDGIVFHQSQYRNTDIFQTLSTN